jgi:hypothetical protein
MIHALPRGLTLALLLAAAGALAQPAALAGPKTDPSSGVQYVSGGVGSEEQDAMKAMESQYPLRIVFSRPGGAYLVVDKLTLRDAGKVVLTLSDAGPLVFAKLPPGRYTADAELKGSVQHRTIEVGRDARSLNWAWGAAGDR